MNCIEFHELCTYCVSCSDTIVLIFSEGCYCIGLNKDSLHILVQQRIFLLYQLQAKAQDCSFRFVSASKVAKTSSIQCLCSSPWSSLFMGFTISSHQAVISIHTSLVFIDGICSKSNDEQACKEGQLWQWVTWGLAIIRDLGEPLILSDIPRGINLIKSLTRKVISRRSNSVGLWFLAKLVAPHFNPSVNDTESN